MYKGKVKKKKLKENFDGFCLPLQTFPGDVTLQRNQKETAATQAIKTIINLLTAVNTTPITVCSLTGLKGSGLKTIQDGVTLSKNSGIGLISGESCPLEEVFTKILLVLQDESHEEKQV